MRKFLPAGLLVFLALAAAPASAQPSATLTLNPTHGRSGSVMNATYSGGQCPNDFEVRFYWSSQQLLGTAPISDPNTCTASKQLTVPSASCSKDYSVLAQLWSSNGPIEGYDAQAAFRVDCAPSASPTPTTAPPTSAPPSPTRSASASARPTSASPSASSSPSPTVVPTPAAPSPTASAPPDTAPREDPSRAPTVTLSTPDSDGGTDVLPWAIGGAGVLATWGATYLGVLRPRGVGTAVVAGTGAAAVLVAGGLIGVPVLSAGDVREVSLTIVRNTSNVTIPRGESGSVEASCPKDHQPVGGGYRTDWSTEPRTGDIAQYNDTAIHYREYEKTSVRFGPRLKANRPTETGWRVEAFNATTNTRPVVASAIVICARDVSDFFVGSTAQTSMKGNAVGTSSAVCRSGNLLAVGWENTVGVVVDTTADRSRGSLSAMTDLREFGGVQAVVLCGTVPGYSIVTGGSTSIAFSSIGRATGRCTGGRAALGGAYLARRDGAESPRVYQYVTPIEAYPDGSEFTVGMFNHLVPYKVYPADLETWGICARTK